MKTSTLPPPAPAWHVLDAEGKSLGRMATVIAHVLRGKHRPSFSPHQLCGDHVVVVNVSKIAMSPAKGRRKTYYHHTGYLGSMSSATLGELLERDPLGVLEHAVKGMLPGNRLRPKMIQRLHLFKDAEHTYAAQKPQPLTITL